MERGWDRTHTFRRLDAERIEALTRSALPGRRVREAVPLTSGLRNTNYRLSFDDGSAAVLRLYEADPSACARETAILRSLAGRIPVPAVLYGEPEAEVPFALLEWLDGEPLDRVLARVDAATALRIAADCGAALAAIHETRFDASGFLGPDLAVRRAMPAWAEAMADEVARAAEHLGSGLAHELASLVSAREHYVEPVWAAEPVLVHADFKPWNLLSGSSHDLTGVLDWEFACSGCRLIDFGTFLRDLGSRPAGYGEAFAGAYVSAGGVLPPEWPRLTLLVDLLSLVQMASGRAGRALVDLRTLISGTLEEAGR
jgi:aminoglycoside phosphotransferase (APT) family kinase protein